ncbi:metal-sulfur cluster assembly factor [Limnobacter sp.]|uniref:metal-sulfur cluster assembly factor n=1 Tax=Limnobacter sp. TaxID=2003368 RepID=UPI00312036A5
MQLREQIIASLREVYDPEISINVYDLGLIYDIEIIEDHVHVKHTLTSFACPFAEQICNDIYDACISTPGVETVERELVWNPPFGPDMVPEETKFAMGWD